MDSDIQKVKEQLRLRVEDALLNNPRAEVIRALEAKKLEYQAMQLYSTKGGVFGTPDFDKLQICINILDEIIQQL